MTEVCRAAQYSAQFAPAASGAGAGYARWPRAPGRALARALEASHRDRRLLAHRRRVVAGRDQPAVLRRASRGRRARDAFRRSGRGELVGAAGVGPAMWGVSIGGCEAFGLGTSRARR